MALYIVIDEVDCETEYRKYYSDIKTAAKAFKTVAEENPYDNIYLEKWESKDGQFQRKACIWKQRY